MEDVARAVGVSRQTLYKKFSTKIELFRAVLAYIENRSLEMARAAIRDTSVSLPERLFNVSDSWGEQDFKLMKSSPHSHEVIALATLECTDDMRRRELEFRHFSAELLVQEKAFDDMEDALDAMTALEKGAIGAYQFSKDYDEYRESVSAVIRIVVKASNFGKL